jgi:hypothetical protein
MRKRVARALIFLVVAVAAALGASTAAGAFDSSSVVVTNPDGIIWE